MQEPKSPHCRQAARVLCGCLALATMGLTAVAQERPDISVTYATVKTAHTADLGSIWLQGGAVEAHAQVYKGLGAVCNVTGSHLVSHQQGAAPLDMVTFAAGVRYVLGRGRRVSPFGEALLGVASAFHGVFPTVSGPLNAVTGTNDSANSLAAVAGGGVDVRLNRDISLRAVEAEYFRTQLPNGAANVQNSLRLATGIVLRFGR